VIDRGAVNADDIRASGLHRQWKGRGCPLLSSWE
jgi:hypothetical protein